MDVADWLRALGLEQYGTTFRENDVDAELLPKITAESLRELGTRCVGDGILTYFGWPTAHEDDAERAVRAALEIVHTVEKVAEHRRDLVGHVVVRCGYLFDRLIQARQREV
jgi:class 3 adenylate cyclase